LSAQGWSASGGEIGAWKLEIFTHMATKYKERLIGLECVECHRVNYYSTKNKKKLKEKLELMKHCKHCKKHTAHKEVKIK
jgi:large subunit ribosomal protein L33